MNMKSVLVTVCLLILIGLGFLGGQYISQEKNQAVNDVRILGEAVDCLLSESACKVAGYTLEFKGSQATDKHFFKWGARYQYQAVDDVLNEWEMIDSAGYSLPNPTTVPGDSTPYNPDFQLRYSANATNQLYISRFAAYASGQWNFNFRNNDLFTSFM